MKKKINSSLLAPPRPTVTVNIKHPAVIQPLLGNGVCNKDTNNIECSYDFGDCCSHSNLVADGVCHDEANNPECNYDGGDCCLLNINKDQCREVQNAQFVKYLGRLSWQAVSVVN